MAIDQLKGIGKYLEAREEIIKSYRWQGKESEIQIDICENLSGEYSEGLYQQILERK